MTWRVAKSLLKLKEQVNQAFPDRSKDSDGTIGDEHHSARASDHNPDTDGDDLNDGKEYTSFTFVFQFCSPESGGPQTLTVNGFSSNELYRLNPNSEDSDGDTLLDGDELNTLGTNPTLVDTDNDDINDNQDDEPLCGGDIVIIDDEDSDGDRLLDDDETAGLNTAWGVVETDPFNDDSDGDGLFDGDGCSGGRRDDGTVARDSSAPGFLSAE